MYLDGVGGQRQRQVNNFISWKQQQNQHFQDGAGAASAWHCQLKLTVKQTTQQGHLSSDNFQKEKCRFSACFSLFVGVADSVQSSSELINHLLCVSFIFTMPQSQSSVAGNPFLRI